MDASSHRAVPQHGEPARAPASAPRAPQAAPAARVVVRRERRPQRPPMAEVEALWKHAHPLEPGAEPEALTRFYQRHQITGANVLPWKLACTLPLGEPLPPWLPEPRGVPLALSLFDERGRRRGLWPVAARRQPEGFNLRGLVAANPCGWVLLLGEDPVGWRWNGRVVVATTPGEFLRWASCESRHAVIGGWAPCWCEAAARCVPREAEVIIRGPNPKVLCSAFPGREVRF